MRKHGLAGSSPLDSKRHPLYARWVSMRQRCNNPNHPKWPDYGGRRTPLCPGGIWIDQRWDDFAQFVEHVGLPPGRAYSLDRINNDGPYAPWNVRWATAAAQRENQYRAPWPFGVLWDEKVQGAEEAEYWAYREHCEQAGIKPYDELTMTNF